jgi:hypothetical protein
MKTPSTGISVINNISHLSKTLLIYQFFFKGIKGQNIVLFIFVVTTCKIGIKSQNRTILPHQFRLTQKK